MVQELHRMMELPFVSMVATIIEIVDDREVHKVGKVREAKVLNWNLHSFQLLEII